VLDWQSDVRPVLAATYEAIKRGDEVTATTDIESINEVLGRDSSDDQTYRVLVALKTQGYISGTQVGGSGFDLIQLEERGLQEVAGWPTRPGEDTYAQLLAVLSELIAQAPTAEERTKFERLRDALVGIGRDVLTDVLAKVATGGGPLVRRSITP
jgi:hypothetical protein